VLSKVPGPYVAAALQKLPRADTDALGICTIDHQVPELGLVRFFVRRKSSRRGKSRHSFWSAERAVLFTP
jgi:hypothetical protein